MLSVKVYLDVHIIINIVTLVWNMCLCPLLVPGVMGHIGRV